MVTLNDHPAIRSCSLASTSNRLTSRTPLAAEACPRRELIIFVGTCALTPPA